MRSLTSLALTAVLLSTVFTAGPAFAFGSDTTPSNPRIKAEESDFTRGKAAMDAGDYGRAVELMKKVAAVEPRNADALNYVGFGYRKLGDFGQSLEWYQRALAVDPTHRGANEYLGELYLQMGDLARAEERLVVLDKACTFGCEEYDELKKAIADFKAGKQAEGKS
jgi:tetratricopeptide (TPR) repeat protein